MAERCFALGNGGAFLHADLYGILLAEKWQVEQALFFSVVQVLENHIVVVLLLVVRSGAGSGRPPIEARQTSIAVNAAFMMWFFILFLFFSFSKIAIHKFIKIPGPMKVGRVFFRCRQRIL